MGNTHRGVTQALAQSSEEPSPPSVLSHEEVLSHEKDRLKTRSLNTSRPRQSAPQNIRPDTAVFHVLRCRCKSIYYLLSSATPSLGNPALENQRWKGLVF